MGATEILRYIAIGAVLIAFGFGAVAAFFAYRYRREIRQAEIHRAQRSRKRILEQEAPAQAMTPRV